MLVQHILAPISQVQYYENAIWSLQALALADYSHSIILQLKYIRADEIFVVVSRGSRVHSGILLKYLEAPPSIGKKSGCFW